MPNRTLNALKRHTTLGLAVAILVLLAIATIVFGIQVEKKHSELEFTTLKYQFERDIILFASELTHYVSSANIPSSNYQELISRILDKEQFNGKLQTVYLTSEDSTFYSSDAGNPHQNYVVTMDDSDYASTPASLINKPFWQYYFLTNNTSDSRLWQDPFNTNSILLTLPFYALASDVRLLLVVSLRPSQWITTKQDNIELALKNATNLIWNSKPLSGTEKYGLSQPLTLSNSMTLVGHYHRDLLPYFLPVPLFSLFGVFLYTSSAYRKKNHNDLHIQKIICEELKLIAFETDTDANVLWVEGELPLGFKAFKINTGECLKETFASSPRYLSYIQHSLNGEKLTYEIDDDDYSVRVHQWPIVSSFGEISGINIFIQEITEQRAIEFQLNHQQFHDDLTGLPNRQLFMEHLQHEIHKAKRRQEFVAVLALEVNGIGIINKQFGHQVGDKMLQEVSKEIKTILRNEDTFCRYSGDEFLLSFENFHQPEELQQIAERLIDIATSQRIIERQTLSLSANIGIATYPKDAKDPGSLVSSAITAMRHARQTGRNTLDYFSADTAKKANEKWQMEQELTHALNAHAFTLHYQPIFNIKTNQCIGAEALIRWPGTNLSPDQFIPLAEETGLIYRMGMWVIESALIQFTQWRQQNSSIQYLSVNLSVAQLDDPDFFSDLDALITRYPFNEGEIILEITESVMMKTNEVTVAKLNQLRARGFFLAIDDFGTGFSSLNYLKHLPVNIIKVDRSFVDGIPKNADDTVICEAIIKMALAMGLHIIAEGVETPDQMLWLVGHEVTAAQGYFFAHAVSPEQFKPYLGLV